MAGTITVGTISDGSNSGSATDAIKGSARAWVNFIGTGTVTINGSYNISSVTDNATGQFTLNFTNAFPNTIYTLSGVASRGNHANADSTICVEGYSNNWSTTAVKVHTVHISSFGYHDPAHATFVIHSA